MSVYLAGAYGRREELAAVREQLRAMGYDVQARWVDGTHDITDAITAECNDGAAADALRSHFAQEDMEDAESCDLMISFTGGSVRGRGGRHVEFGIGLAANCDMWLVGPRENVFHWLPCVTVFATTEAMLEYAAFRC